MCLLSQRINLRSKSMPVNIQVEWMFYISDTKFGTSKVKVLLKPQGCLLWKTPYIIFLHPFSYSFFHCVSSDHRVTWEAGGGGRCRTEQVMGTVNCGGHSFGVSSPIENISFIAGCVLSGSLSKHQKTKGSCTIHALFRKCSQCKQGLILQGSYLDAYYRSSLGMLERMRHLWNVGRLGKEYRNDIFSMGVLNTFWRHRYALS